MNFCNLFKKETYLKFEYETNFAYKLIWEWIIFLLKFLFNQKQSFIKKE